MCPSSPLCGFGDGTDLSYPSEWVNWAINEAMDFVASYIGERTGLFISGDIVMTGDPFQMGFHQGVRVK